MSNPCKWLHKQLVRLKTVRFGDSLRRGRNMGSRRGEPRIPLGPEAQFRDALPKAKRGKTPEKSSVFTLATIATDYTVLPLIYKRFRQNG
jgi:hypothetical protein